MSGDARSAEAPLPAGTQRLFGDCGDGEDLAGLASAEARPFVIERLLEQGDGEDLRWLARVSSEKDFRGVFERRARRSLSTRSRRFWSLVLEGELDASEGAGAEIWPLAGTGP
ncbi:MAG: hypothetical protein AAF725_01230 [Acidobacteriota bacterium]